jgi:hypothetical protein
VPGAGDGELEVQGDIEEQNEIGEPPLARLGQERGFR